MMVAGGLLVAGGLIYSAEHGHAGPLYNGPEVTQTQDPLPPAENTPSVRTMAPTDLQLPK